MKAPSQSNELTKSFAITPQTNAYEVGYGKPPELQRFKPGCSGNPKGRPKGSKNLKHKNAIGPLDEKLKDIILEEAYRSIRINEGTRQIDLPIAQAVTRSIAHNAVKGSVRAQRLFAEMVATTEASRKQENLALFEQAIEYKLQWEREISRCQKHGLPVPQPLPHPDDIKLDPRTGSVRFAGPTTKEEKLELDFLKYQKDNWEKEVVVLEKSLKKTRKPEIRAIMEQELAFGQDFLVKLRRLFPEPDIRIKWVEDYRRENEGQ